MDAPLYNELNIIFPCQVLPCRSLFPGTSDKEERIASKVVFLRLLRGPEEIGEAIDQGLL